MMVYDSNMRGEKAASKAPYHHGDLAEVMMGLAIQHIEAQGTEKLSLRALAREAGVSQSAPYRHFPTKRCLLAALATQGFTILHDKVEAVVTTDLPIEDRFIAMGVAYVEFALEHPTHYHLMFGAVLGDFSDYDMLKTAAEACFTRVTEVQHELVTTRGLELDEQRFAGVVWAGVHGIASLMTNMDGPDRELNSNAMSSVQHMRRDIEESIKMMFAHLVGPR